MPFKESTRLILYSQVFFGTMAVVCLAAISVQQAILTRDLRVFSRDYQSVVRDIDKRISDYAAETNRGHVEDMIKIQNNETKLEKVERDIESDGKLLPAARVINQFGKALREKPKAETEGRCP